MFSKERRGRRGRYPISFLRHVSTADFGQDTKLEVNVISFSLCSNVNWTREHARLRMLYELYMLPWTTSHESDTSFLFVLLSRFLFRFDSDVFPTMLVELPTHKGAAKTSKIMQQ